MSLFGFGRKNSEEGRACSCGESKASVPRCPGSSGEESDGALRIAVLGAGCKSCREQYENVMAAVQAMKLPAEPEYITDMERVMEFGAMRMPAIAVNGKPVSMGRVLKTAEVERLLRDLGL